MRRLASPFFGCALLAAPAQVSEQVVPINPLLAAGVTYLVNSTTDAPDADASNGVCAGATSHCTLRAAIMKANFVTGVNTITVPSGVYLLNRSGTDDTALVGDLDITDQLTIQGAGPAATIVDANSAVTHDRVFQVLKSAVGAGIYAIEWARVELFNDTIAGNLLSLGHLQTNPLRGSGVFITNSVVITAQNTLIANNLFADNISLFGPDDCFRRITSLGTNLIESMNNCLFSGTTFGNITGQDPVLEPLQYNGGATQTQALLAGSPAIDVAQTLTPGCTDHAGAPLTTDQRGFARPGGAHCDIGAFEYYSPGPFLPLIRR